MIAIASENRPAPLRRKLALVALLHAITFTYFIQGGGYNQVARVSEVRMFVERGHFNLDEFASLTHDTSHLGGKVFSNKTPSMLFFVAPVYAMVYQTARLAKVDVHSDRYQLFATQLITFLCAGLFGILLGQLIFFLWGELFVKLSENDRLFFAAMVPIATMIFPYATMAMVNVFETFWVTLTIFSGLRFLRSSPAPKPAALLAFSYGVAVLADPILLLVSPAIAWMVLKNRERRWPITFTSAAVFLATLVPWLVYNRVNFGSAFITNPQLQDAWLNRPGLLLGVFDFPRPGRILQVLFWGNHSLFPTQGYLLLFIPGLYLLIRERTFSRETWWLLGGALFPYVLFICTFNIWYGGDGYGPRYFMPALIVLICWSIPVYQRWKKLYAVWVFATFIAMLIVTSVDPLFGFTPGVQSPFWESALPNFLHGRLSLNSYVMFASTTTSLGAANLGSLLFGLHGLPSLAPLLIAQSLVAARLIRDCTRDLAARPWRLLPTALNSLAGAMTIAILTMVFTLRAERRDEGDRALDASLQLYRAGRFLGSIAAARQALEVHPDWAAAHNNICACYNQLKLWDAAIAACQTAIALDPNDQLARNNLLWAQSKH